MTTALPKEASLQLTRRKVLFVSGVRLDSSGVKYLC